MICKEKIQLMMVKCLLFLASGLMPVFAQVPDTRLWEIASAPSTERLTKDIRTLAGFGTRNTFSDTVSNVRGIGAARRWIFQQFKDISAKCGQCLDVYYQKGLIKAGSGDRAKTDVWVVNVVAIQRGKADPNRLVMMAGDIDSRNSDPTDPVGDAPGANDNASGMAGVIEAARVLSQYSFPSSIAYVGLSGEEQGLWGGRFLAEDIRSKGWDLAAVLNNDMIGNTTGIDGIKDNRTFRIFSEATEPNNDERTRNFRRFYGWESEGISRQLARYVHRITNLIMPDMHPMLVYRLDRFGRGGHHRPFNDLGYAGIRIMEAHENYNRQHQNLRTENGIVYGDVLEGVDFDYAAKLTAVNAITLAALAWAPPAPQEVKIGGAVTANTTLSWRIPESTNLAGFKIYWRDTTAPQWQFSRYVGLMDKFTLTNIVIDNYYFGVASVGNNGYESPVAFPVGVINR